MTRQLPPAKIDPELESLLANAKEVTDSLPRIERIRGESERRVSWAAGNLNVDDKDRDTEADRREMAEKDDRLFLIGKIDRLRSVLTDIEEVCKKGDVVPWLALQQTASYIRETLDDIDK